MTLHYSCSLLVFLAQNAVIFNSLLQLQLRDLVVFEFTCTIGDKNITYLTFL